jgi:hypothetical protein
MEAGHAVLEAPEAHERVAPLDRDALGCGLDDEGADPAATALVLGHPGHHHDQLGDDPVGGPQLDAVEEVRRTVVGEGGRRRHPGGVGADVGLGEQERGDRASGAAGQEPLLLLVGAEHLHRFGDSDRLVSRQECAEARMNRAEQHQCPAVVGHAEPEAAVLAWDLHAEGADLRECREVVVGDLVLALDALAVEPFAHRTQLGQEGFAALDVGGGAAGVRVHQGEVEAAQVEALGEARTIPLGLARSLGQLAGLGLGGVHAGARWGLAAVTRRLPGEGALICAGVTRVDFRFGHVVGHQDLRLTTVQCYPEVMNREGRGRPDLRNAARWRSGRRLSRALLVSPVARR